MATKKSTKTTKAAVNDRQKALETALEQIEKDFGKGAVMRLGIEDRKSVV